jgi:hypothetical protein
MRRSVWAAVCIRLLSEAITFVRSSQRLIAIDRRRSPHEAAERALAADDAMAGITSAMGSAPQAPPTARRRMERAPP